MVIREIKTSDAEKLAVLMQQVDESAEYMLWEKGERSFQPKHQLKMIEKLEKNENSTILVADNSGQFTGYLIVIGGNARRQKHSGYVVIGIQSEHRGKGIGTKLFEELDRWTSKRKLHRLELTVVTQNKAGLSLYKKQGFEIEGVKRDSLFIDGEYHDEYYMGKIL